MKSEGAKQSPRGKDTCGLIDSCAFLGKNTMIGDDWLSCCQTPSHLRVPLEVIMTTEDTPRLSVRIPKTSAEWLRKREEETDVTTSQLIRRLIRLEIESVKELEYERVQPTLENVAEALCLAPAFSKRTSVLISAQKAKE